VVPSCRVRVFPAATGRHFVNTRADYFTKLLEDDLKAVVKPQYVDQIPKAIRAPDKSVKALIEGRASLENLDEVLDTLGRLASVPC
jgi:translation initiation factor RLI1